MLFSTLTPDLCATLARDIFGKPGWRKRKSFKALDKEICSSLLGASFPVCCELWNQIEPSKKDALKGAHPKHLFWALVFLNCYSTVPVLTRVVGGPDDKTFREWSWAFVAEIAGLKPNVIVFNNRFRGWDGEAVCLISIDGTDCAIKEIYPFNPSIFSQKLNGPAFKYEIGACIATGDIVWVNGPFEAGMHDATIFKEEGLRDALCDDEGVEVDGVYQDDEKFKSPNVSQSRKDRRQKSGVRSRQEIVNSRLKCFNVLDSVFRHTKDTKEKHGLCFNAVAVITQLSFEFHGHLHSVEYDVRYD